MAAASKNNATRILLGLNALAVLMLFLILIKVYSKEVHNDCGPVLERLSP
jgi:hypothetical protein